MLIGICGNKGVGKDTAASFLDGYTRMAFADKMKEAVANLLDLTLREVDQGKNFPWMISIEDGVVGNWTFREFLQRFGTEMGRNTFGQNFWIEQWEYQYNDLHALDRHAAKNVVVTDVRFRNEATRIIYYGGHIIEITRPDHKPDGHVSEDGISDDLIDATVYNDSTVDDFRRKFLAVVEGLSVGVVSG